mgnify:CR=1 FL=1
MEAGAAMMMAVEVVGGEGEDMVCYFPGLRTQFTLTGYGYLLSFAHTYSLFA